MRVYTDNTFRTVVSYGKLAIGLIVLFLLLSQGWKMFGDDPAVQEIRNLLQPAQTEQQ